MKTANVKASQMHTDTATLKKVSVNLKMFPSKDTSRKPQSQLSIQGYELRKWLDHLNGSSGVYFLDMAMDRNNYSLHFKHHATSKLMELDCQEGLGESHDAKKELLQALLFDLSLFPDEPVLAFDSDLMETTLRNLSAIYPEHRPEIECAIGRLVNIDLKKVFETGIYHDSRIREISVDGIYHVLYPGSCRTFTKEQSSYGAYLIYIALQSIFYQVLGKEVQA